MGAATFLKPANMLLCESEPALGLSKKSGRFMAKLPKGGTSSSEIGSDLWSRFEFAVDVVAKSPPQHRSKNQKTSEKKEKKPSPTKEG
jgi:hypothetical protein